MDKDRLRRIAGRQLGVFSRAQARDCGYSAFQIRRRIEEGQWRRVFGSALGFAGLQATAQILDLAAQLSVPGSILAGPSAARALGIAVPDTRPHIYVGRHGGARVHGVRLIHEPVDPGDLTVRRGLPCTKLGRSIVDCLWLLPRPEAIRLLDRSLQQRWLLMEEFIALTQARAGRLGAPRLRALMRLVVGGERAASERRLTGLLRRADISGWRANVEVHDDRGLIGIVDVAFEADRLAIEIDGWAFHTTPERFQRDRERQNRLVAAGWTVLRFTWRDITTNPGRMLAAIRRVLS